ncbi:hypothetical protein [Roseovarius mucosus]|uniref:hypothetical protein n=1 Tax=Roseovarius mucosus TaxID=215743 RepID=UPI000A65F950|nr:hypothetical protein [Roseovarius mucosus]
MTGDGDELAGAAPPCLGKGGGPDLGDAPVDGRGEFVENGKARPLGQNARELGAELLAGREVRLGNNSVQSQ